MFRLSIIFFAPLTSTPLRTLLPTGARYRRVGYDMYSRISAPCMVVFDYCEPFQQRSFLWHISYPVLTIRFRGNNLLSSSTSSRPAYISPSIDSQCRFVNCSPHPLPGLDVSCSFHIDYDVSVQYACFSPFLPTEFKSQHRETYLTRSDSPAINL